MPNKNYVLLEGHLGKDAETKTTPGGKKLTVLSVATSYGSKEKKKTIWHHVTAWGNSFAQELKKGAAVRVEGRIDKNEYAGKTYQTITASKITFYSKEEGPGEEGAPPPMADDDEFPPEEE